MTLLNSLRFTIAVGAATVLGGGAAAQTCAIDWNTTYQRIDGFGASCAWTGTPWSDAMADQFFSTDTGLGLSLLRVRIVPDVTGTGSATKMTTGSAEITIAQKAIARGARVWAAPWTPPAQFKTSINTNTGTFISSNNQAYAQMIADYVAQMKSSGVNLYAVSIQNEPDFIPSGYEGCGWSAQQMHDYVPYLYAALQGDGVGSTRILGPESLHWQAATSLAAVNAIMNDPVTAAQVGIIADHNYDGLNSSLGATTTPANLPHTGKALWETEVMTSGDPFDPSIANGLYWAQRIHLFMTAAQANAWHYWWFTPSGSDNQALLGQNGVTTKRMYVLGQFSRFVRPGFYRIAATTAGSALISAYKDPVSGKFAIVAINNTASDISETFTLSNFQASTVTPWITSATAELAKQSDIAVSGTSFTATLAANSVTTYVGTDTTPPPALSSSRITNLSIRSFAGTGDQTLIAGFYVAGGTKPVLIRAGGPAIAFAVQGVLAQPQLSLIKDGNTLGYNAGWDTASNWQAVQDVTPRVGAFPFARGSADSALLSTLSDGLYSAKITGPNLSTGVALAEVYDTDFANGGRLTNVSARTLAGGGDNVLIAGFYINGGEPKTLLIRGVAPTLAAIGLAGTLPDPKLALYASGATTPITTNTAWGTNNPAQIAYASNRVGAFPLVSDSNDTAMVVTLQPGSYSAQLSSSSGTSGVALIEIYELQ